MIGQIKINGSPRQLDDVALELPLREESCWMSLTASWEDGGFGMCEVELQCLEHLDDLDGKRMHVRPDGSTFPDDTLGTDITDMYETTDVNFLEINGAAWSFGEIQLDFSRIQGRKYRVQMKATLTEEDFEYPGDLAEDAYTGSMSAEFEVEIATTTP